MAKTKFLLIVLVIYGTATAQTNKFTEGNFGLRYGISFNGSLAQTVAFSGIINQHIEIGAGISVLYSTTKSSTGYIETAYGKTGPFAANYTNISTSSNVNTSVIPYVVYHFPIKSNVDLYLGGDLNIGTGSFSLGTSTHSTVDGDNYHQESKTTTKYPPGFQVGGAAVVGCQYFFYKKMAVGFEANLGAAYVGRIGKTKYTSEITNTGTNNTGKSIDYSEFTNTIHDYAVTMKSASNASIFFTFFFDKKEKVNKEIKGEPF